MNLLSQPFPKIEEKITKSLLIYNINSKLTNRNGVEQQNDEKTEKRNRPNQIARVDGGQQEHDGGPDEQDAADDGLVNPLRVAGAEGDELTERGVAG